MTLSPSLLTPLIVARYLTAWSTQEAGPTRCGSHLSAATMVNIEENILSYHIIFFWVWPATKSINLLYKHQLLFTHDSTFHLNPNFFDSKILTGRLLDGCLNHLFAHLQSLVHTDQDQFGQTETSLTTTSSTIKSLICKSSASLYLSSHIYYSKTLLI